LKTNAPLQNNSIACDQGVRNDDAWSCSPYVESHKVCGHYGVFTFLYPNYVVSEADTSIRLYVHRSGGGYGNVTINYQIKHFTTDDNDVTATSFYTTSQQLNFEQGTLKNYRINYYIKSLKFFFFFFFFFGKVLFNVLFC
jgi:hypothetical protein